MTSAFTLAVQGRAVAQGGGAAAVALYGYLAGGPETAVVRAARREATDGQLTAMAGWIDACIQQLSDDAAVLASVAAALPDSPLLAVPTEAAVYRTAAEELAFADGACCAAVAWAGVAAESRWSRLYGVRELTLREALADPVVVAARRELGDAACVRIATEVGARWERIDERASTRT